MNDTAAQKRHMGTGEEVMEFRMRVERIGNRRFFLADLPIETHTEILNGLAQSRWLRKLREQFLTTTPDNIELSTADVHALIALDIKVEGYPA